MQHVIIEAFLQPEGAANRCLDCPSNVEKNCPYSAKRIYLDGVNQVETGLIVSSFLSNENPFKTHNIMNQ